MILVTEMNKRPSIQFYPADWLKATDLQLCCMATQGVWINLMCRMWETHEEGKIRATADEFCKLLGCSEKVFSQFLKDSKAHGFCDVTKRNAHVTIICRRMHRAYIARDGTKTRVKEHRARAQRSRNAKVTSPSSTTSSTTTTTTKNKGAKHKSEPKEYTTSFLAFWKAYPRHDGKFKAAQAFDKAGGDEELLGKIVAALEWQKPAWTDPQYIPHATTYLNQRRWEDEPTKALSAQDVRQAEWDAQMKRVAAKRKERERGNEQ